MVVFVIFRFRDKEGVCIIVLGIIGSLYTCWLSMHINIDNLLAFILIYSVVLFSLGDILLGFILTLFNCLMSYFLQGIFC